MVKVIVGEHECFEAALRRFGKKVQQHGILVEARRRIFFESRGARRRRKDAAAARRRAKGK